MDHNVKADGKLATNNPTKLYSKAVGDTFSIFIALPPEYDSKDNTKYLAILLLDANLYFDIFAVTLNKYAEVGMLPRAILVGIGCKDFREMDSFRSRDYTYPTAIAAYEMSVSGKADKFLSFINSELVPDIDLKYLIDKNNRLAGAFLGRILYYLRTSSKPIS